MCASSFDDRFSAYRVHLRTEIERLASYFAIYRRIYERMADRLPELNLAPAFFGVTLDALFSVIVMWTHKLLDENADRGMFNFLMLLEYNRASLSSEALKRRNAYPDGHWMLDREEVTLEGINQDRAALRALTCLSSIATRRDKFHAHFDKAYAFDRAQLAKDAPLMWNEIEQANGLMHEILNRYSAAYDGTLYATKPMNIHDVDRLLDALHSIKK